MSESTLPPELISLVHHIELNKAGWWHRAVQHLILSTIWTSDRHLTSREITESLRMQFQASLDEARVKKQLDLSCSSGVIICLPDGRYKISESFINKYGFGLQEAEDIEKSTATEFIALIAQHCPLLDGDKAWREFNAQFLLPLVREVGANTYRLLSQGHPHLDPARFDRYVKSYPTDVREPFSNAVEQFLGQGNAKVRAYLLRSLTAFFLIESTSLSEETLQALTRFTDTRPTFNLFLDTNYLFSVLDLTTSTSNDTSLNDILGQLQGRLSVKLYALPITIDEARRVLVSVKRGLSGLRLSPNLAQAALGTRLNGIHLKYFEEVSRRGTISADDYFNPYIDDFLTVMRAKGVELYNEDTDSYNTRQDVIDDLMARLELEKRRYHDEGKSYEQLEHDMVLWHFVHDKRPRELDSPIEATNWVVTLDYRLLGHDEYKQRVARTKIPICLHPASLMQMFQFWIPRTQEFEEAMFNSMRLPFFGRGFDAEAERVTVDILKTLSRFEDVGDLQTQTVSSMLVNRALRQTISAERDEEQKIKLVRDALIQQHHRTQQQLQQISEEAERLKKEAEGKEEKNQLLDEAIATKDREMENLGRKMLQLEEQSRSEKEVLAGRIKDLEAGLQAKEHQEQARAAQEALRTDRRDFLLKRGIIPMLAVLAAMLGLSYGLAKLAGIQFWRSAIPELAFGLAVLALLIDRSGSSKPSIEAWPLFKTFQKIKNWIWGVLIMGMIVGVLGNALYEWIKK